MKKLQLFLIFLGASFFGSAQNATLQHVLDSVFDVYAQHQGFLGKVSLMKGNEVIYNRDLARSPQNTQQYRIGSVSKVFTATAIMQLIDANQLALTTTLDKFYPAIKNAELITIGNLLSHTSGVFDVIRAEGYFDKRDQVYTKADILNIITTHKPSFKPNADCSYSNSNYILLGYILEDILKQPLQQVLNERVVQRIGLKQTYLEVGASDRSKREKSYLYDGEKWLEDKDSHPDFPAGAGAVVSNTIDLCHFMHALFHGQLVSDSSLKVMTSLKGRSTGHGLFKSPFYNHVGWGHSGRIDEFHAFTAYFADDSLSLAITTNGLHMQLNDILIPILSAYYGKEIPKIEFPSCDVESPATEKFEGNYKAKLFRLITVARFSLVQAGKNHLFMTDQYNGKGTKSLLSRKGEYVFYSGEADGDLVFSFDKKGRAKRIELKQNGITIRCKRKSFIAQPYGVCGVK